MRPVLVTALGVVAILALAACRGAPPPSPTPPPQQTTLSLTSDAFQSGGPIPERFTCDGEDVSPPLAWSGVPQDTASFALIMDDPDAPGGTFTHWVIFNIPGGARTLPEGVPTADRLDSGALQGRNDFSRTGYGGPCPPSGAPHRYRFTLYALDTTLALNPGASKRQVQSAMQGHILGQVTLVGTYQR